uniref:Uncharacterized protein n=1 Tax=Hyaloperonospora arabidopsidis (strain Emoy2) TaxID=559515 RepID=M4B2Y8_HYAAE
MNATSNYSLIDANCYETEDDEQSWPKEGLMFSKSLQISRLSCLTTSSPFDSCNDGWKKRVISAQHHRQQNIL